MQLIIKRYLTAAGAQVDVAKNGVDVDRYLEDDGIQQDGQFYDATLLDMMLPDVTGYEVAEKLRSRFDSLPIVALTAGAMVHDRQRCLDAGCTDYLTKPIDRAELINLLQSLCRLNEADEKN